MPNNLPIRLDKKIDKYGKNFYIGKLQFPGTLDLKAGAIFFVFISEEGQEEIQIGVLREDDRTNDDRNAYSDEEPILRASSKPPNE